MPATTETPKDRIILGLMTVGPRVEDGARITDMATFQKAMDLFQGRGYNEVDSARSYVASQQEAYMRKAGWKERGLTMATKLEVEDIPHANVDDTQEALVPTLELALVEDLDSDNRRLLDHAVQ